MRQRIDDLVQSYIGRYFKKKDKDEFLNSLLKILDEEEYVDKETIQKRKDEAEQKAKETKEAEKKRRMKASRTAVIAEPTTDQYGRMKTTFRRHETK